MFRYLSFLDPLFLQKRCTLYCEPVTIMAISAVAMSAAATGASLKGQHDQAKATAKYQEALATANVAAARDQSNQVRDQQSQTNEATARQAQQAVNTARQAESTAAVSAGEAGVSGNSVESLLRDYRAQEGAYKESLLRQQQLTSISSDQQITAIRSAADTGNLGMNAPIGQPNYLAGALSFGAQAASTYVAANPRQPQTKTTAAKS